jgi:hypothetical protein
LAQGEKLLESMPLTDCWEPTRAGLPPFHPDPERYASEDFVNVGLFESAAELIHGERI